MKYFFLLIPVSLLLFLNQGGSKPTETIHDYGPEYHSGLNELQTKAEYFHHSVTKGGSQQELIKAFHSCKKAYKRVEFLTDYLDHEFCNRYLNGAPLLKLEKNSPVPTSLEPEGLQRLEELVYENPPNIGEIKKLSGSFVSSTKKFYKVQTNLTIQDRQAFDAMRYGIYRIFTLDLSGFDCPSSDSAVSNALYSFGSIAAMYQEYEDELRQKNEKLFDETTDRFSEAKAYLQSNQDFEEFNRLYFLREFLNPLCNAVLKSRESLGIEKWSEVFAFDRSVSETEGLLFGSEFLNPYFFSKFPEEEDSEIVQALGKELFFDPNLSSNGQRSCASCHNPKLAFSDGKRKSISFDQKSTTPRNSPGLINAIYAEKYFLDLRSEDLESQIENVLFSSKEFAHDWKTLEESLLSKGYDQRFTQAFPQHKERPINKYTVASALTSYLISLQGLDSEFDQYARGETQEIDPEVEKGFNLFMGKAACATCHFPPTFSGLVPPYYYETESEVLGVPSEAAEPFELDKDLGRYDGRLEDRIDFFKHSFKTPTVRNIQHTAPYMHNGVYDSLEQVVDFYNRGGGMGLGLDVPFQTLPGDSLELNSKEINQLIAFMNALEDLSSADTLMEIKGY